MSDRKTAFITGASRTIGRATAITLAKQGFNLVITSHADEAACNETAAAAAEHGAETLVCVGDIGDKARLQDINQAALDRFGAIDVLVNNAAIRPRTPFLEMDEAEWHHVLNVDMNAAFYTSQAFLPGMVERGWDRIINVTGMNAIQGTGTRAHVSAAKHGLWGLTRALAHEFGPKGITVNAISPGPIESARSTDEDRAAHAAKVPLGGMGKPDHIAAAVSFLVSEGGGYTTGQMIAVNGGAQTGS